MACAAIIGLEPGVPRDDDSGVDASEAGVVYSDVTDSTKWTTFDLQSLLGAQAGFAGGTFDGRHVYFSPVGGDTVLRYDTFAVFGVTSSWEKYNLTTLNMNARGYYGATLANNRVVFAPYLSGLSAWFDTQKPLDAGFVLRQTGAPGYIGSSFDGRAIYFVPHYSAANMAYQGVALRYSLDAGPDASPWSSFDTAAKINPNAGGYFGSVFDGRYLYYTPYGSVWALRYDTTLAFTDVLSWKWFDLRMIRPDALYYTTAAFDGRYVYLVPRGANSPHGLVLRYDTMSAFDKAPSWSVFDTTQISPVAKGFGGSAFDGRYLYFTPTQNGLVVRYDTQGTFVSVSAWSSFDVATKASIAKSYVGAVFDGKYVYFVPASTSVVARFEARATPAAPLPYNGGSFF